MRVGVHFGPTAIIGEGVGSLRALRQPHLEAKPLDS